MKEEATLNIRRHGFKRLLLAVSGGLDSICLAHYFIENRKTLGIEWLGIAHVHHGLREGTADRDAEFVETFAKSHNVPFFLKRLDGEALKAAEGSLEENARDARYKALMDIASISATKNCMDPRLREDDVKKREDDAKKREDDVKKAFGSTQDDNAKAKFRTPNSEILIVTAHHAGDQAETMFMRLKRGTTLAGLRGIQEVRAIGNNVTLKAQTANRVHGSYRSHSSLQDDTTETLFNCSSPLSTAYCLLPTISIYRPFLNVTRAELLEYAREHDLTWCEDESNADVKFARNSVRHHLLPRLEKEVPGATKQLCRIAKLVDKAYAKIIKKCEDAFEKCMDPRLREDDKEKTVLETLRQAQGDTTHASLVSCIALDKKKLNKILAAHRESDLSELFRLWLSEKGFRFPIGFFYGAKEPAHVKIPVRTVYRRRSIVKIRHTVWICEFQDAQSAAKFVSCEMKEKDYNEST